jgi:hypothetical protein
MTVAAPVPLAAISLISVPSESARQIPMVRRILIASLGELGAVTS